MKHTPGPWKWGPIHESMDGSIQNLYAPTTPGLQEICGQVINLQSDFKAVLSINPKYIEKADANLIAAAPDLLFAAQLCMKVMCMENASPEDRIKAVTYLGAAIGRAGGELPNLDDSLKKE